MADLIIPKIWEGKEVCICVTEERAVFVCDLKQNKFIDTGETAIELPPHGDLIDRDEIQLKHDPLYQWFATAEMLKKVPTVVESTKTSCSEFPNSSEGDTNEKG